MGDHDLGGARAPRSHCGAVRPAAQRVGVQQVERRELAAGERGGDARRAERLALERRVARPVAAGEARLAQAAAVRRVRDAEQARAVAAGQAEAAREVQQRARRGGAARAGEQALAVDDHDVLARAGEELGQLAHGVGVGARRGGRAAEVPVVAGQRRVEPDEHRLRPAGGEAQDGLGVRVERAGARAGHGEAHVAAADALADAQVEHRRVVDRVAVEHEHGVGELEVGHGGLQRRVGQRAAQRRPAARRRRREARWPEPRPSRKSACRR